MSKFEQLKQSSSSESQTNEIQETKDDEFEELMLINEYLYFNISLSLV